MCELDPLKLASLEEINKAYEKLCSEEKSLSDRLEWQIENRHHLEARLSQLSHVAPTLQILRADAKKLSNTINITSQLANNVSAKVRDLDNAKCRVSEVQKRVGDLLDLEGCANGVQASLAQQDYEMAAGHIHRFLSMDEKVLSHSSDAAHKSNVGMCFERLRAAKLELKETIIKNFDTSVMKQDEASIERFFKLFPLIDLKEVGLEKFSKYLTDKIQKRSEANLKRALSQNVKDKRSHVVWADTITLLFEDIARVIEVRQPIIETFYMPGHLYLVAEIVQNQCDADSNKIITEMINRRKLNEIVNAVQEALEKPIVANPSQDDKKTETSKLPDPRSLDSLLGELTLMNARAELYVRFLKRRILSDFEAGVTDIAARKEKIEKFNSKLGRSTLACDMAVLIGNYTILEQFYLNESFKKAVSMDFIETENSDDQKISSLVDDAFYIIKKCVRRAIASSSVDGVCVMLNHSNDLLERQLAPKFQQTLKRGFPVQGYLDLTQAYSAFQSSIQTGKLHSGAGEANTQRHAFLAALNNSETSGRYVVNLSEGFRSAIETAMSDLSHKDKAKLECCLEDLSETKSVFKNVTSFGFNQLHATALKPKVKPWIDSFNNLSHELTEIEFNSNQSFSPFSQQLIENMDSLINSFKETLTPENLEKLIENLVKEISDQFYKIIFKATFNRLGGLQLDREVRCISTYLSQVSEYSAREHLTTLSQAAILLNLEQLSEVLEYSSRNSWKLNPKEMRKVLLLRTDFNKEEIQKLKL